MLAVTGVRTTWMLAAPISAGLLSASIVLAAAGEPPTPGASSVLVYSLDKHYEGVVRLKPLQPLPESLKAILAMYALQKGADCRGYDESGLRCRLTTALGLGAQCSRKHVQLVRTWFASGFPNMGGYSEPSLASALQSGDLASMCYGAPEGATRQQTWLRITVRRENDLVFVDATSFWMSGVDGPTGEHRYASVYRLGPDEVGVVSHKLVSAKRTRADPNAKK